MSDQPEQNPSDQSTLDQSLSQQQTEATEPIDGNGEKATLDIAKILAGGAPAGPKKDGGNVSISIFWGNFFGKF